MDRGHEPKGCRTTGWYSYERAQETQVHNGCECVGVCGMGVVVVVGTRAVGLQHECAAATARSKVTIRKRLRDKLHPSSKLPIVGIHRIFVNSEPLVAMVKGCLKPGMHHCSKEEKASQDEVWPLADEFGVRGLALFEDMASAHSLEGDEEETRALGLM